MAKVPLSAKKEIPRKCILCEKKFKSKEYLVSHIGKAHKLSIPKGWSASRYENYLRTNKDHGSCIVCGEDTEWNESTWKYNRICNKKKCHKEVANKAKKNMIGKYGKVHLLNDPDMQRKMIYAKRTSGTYIWTDDTKKEYPQHYASQPEKAFLEMLDAFLNLEASDVESPSPHTYVYTYEGKEHQYIPDHYIRSLNLEIEIKEPSDNQNMHPKIQAVDKVKEKLKDELMQSIDEVNYIKINGTDYSKFFALFTKLKNMGDDIPMIDNITKDGLNRVSAISNFMSDYDRMVAKADEVKTSIALATNKKQGFKDILDTLDQRLFKVDTIRDCLDLKSYSLALKKQFGRYLTVEDGEHRLKYEAGKAIAYIDDYLLPQIDIKMESLRRRGITEGFNFSAEKHGKRFRPVFIILTYGGSLINKITRFGTHQQWTHASIALDTELHNNISFGDKRGGSKLLGFKDDEDTKEQYTRKVSRYAVYLYMATQHEYDIICDVIDEFRRNEDSYRFDILMLLKVWRQKGSDCIDNFVCSTFVAYVLGEANPRLLNKHFSLYSPGDLAENRNFTLINDGSVSDYNPKITDSILSEKIKQLGYTNFKYDDYNKEGIDVVDTMKPVNEATYITCKQNDEEYRPIFIVVSMSHDIPNDINKSKSGKKTFHASIAIDTSLKHNITYGPQPELDRDGYRKYGFTYDEDIMEVHKNKKSAYVIFMYMAHIREFSVLTDILRDFRSRSNVGRYSMRNVINILQGRDTVNTEDFKYSTFISYVLNEMNPTLLKKEYTDMTPNDLMHIRGLVKVDSGLVRKFDEEKFDQTVAKILMKRGFVDVEFKYDESEEDSK